MSRNPDGLTPRQRAFVDAYMINPNATRAAIAAGYRAKNADVTGPRLLGNVRIAVVLERSREVLSERAMVRAEDVIRELARIAFSDMRHFATWGDNDVTLNSSDGLDEDDSRCVAEVYQLMNSGGCTTRIKLHDKVAALTLLGKHFGLFVDRVVYTEAELNSVTPEELQHVASGRVPARSNLGR